MLREIDSCVHHGESFAFETTLSGLSYLRHIREWRSVGYHVSLLFLRLPSPEVAIARVAERVAHGGHNIPEDVIRRRFAAGQLNLNKYRAAVDSWALYDNSSGEPAIVEWGELQ